MTAYFVVMLALMLPAILLPQRKPSPVAWAFAFILLLLFVGLRHKVGMDWNNYLVMIGNVRGVEFLQALQVAEPGYATLLWLSGNAGYGVYGVNLLTTIVFLAGVYRFARSTPLPWIAMVCAMPMLIVVVGMSANRQAAAIGVLMWLVSEWDTASMRKRVSLTLLATLFHLSAVFFLFFSAFGVRMRMSYKVLLVAIFGAFGVFYLQASGGAEYYDQAYLSGQNETTFSAGATQHVLLNGLPALLMLASARFRDAIFPSPVLRQMAWMAIALIPLAFVFSVAAGRMTLYLFPVSMYAFAALPGQFKGGSARAIIRTLVCSAQFGVLWIWLNFANSSLAHVPYANALFLSSWELHL